MTHSVPRISGEVGGEMDRLDTAENNIAPMCLPRLPVVKLDGPDLPPAPDETPDIVTGDGRAPHVRLRH